MGAPSQPFMSDGDPAPRRAFLGAVTVALAGLIGAMAVMPGFTFLSHPLRGETRSAPVSGQGQGQDQGHQGEDPGADGRQPLLVRVAAPEEVRSGRPVRVAVYGEQRDAWARLPRVKLGAAWLVRTGEGGVRAFSAVCPHLGCDIEWDAQNENFTCPGHDSQFGTDGRLLRGPSARGLDELQVAVSEGAIKLRYQRFRVGSRGKEPVP